mgnify:CR=1 FL=1|jgi:hypothetical protein
MAQWVAIAQHTLTPVLLAELSKLLPTATPPGALFLAK